MADGDGQYEFKEVRAIRGTEARTIKKWQVSGWELVTQNPGPLLQAKLTFRRPKPKVPWRLMAVLGGAALLFAIVGSIAGANQGGGEAPQTSAPTSETAVVPSQQPSEEPVTEPKASESEAEKYAYQGPLYEIVAVDENVGVTTLNTYWVYTNRLDYSTDAYKDQVKMIIADIARNKSTAKLMVEIVTDKEIIEAESASTIAGFMEQYGGEYFKNVIVPKEESDWVASYIGGFDLETGQRSESAAAFEVIWFPNSKTEIEKWKPERTV